MIKDQIIKWALVIIISAVLISTLVTNLIILNLEDCTAGEFKNGNTCSKCPGGKYTNYDHAASCMNCGSGLYSKYGDSVCSKCPIGQYSHTSASSCYTTTSPTTSPTPYSSYSNYL